MVLLPATAALDEVAAALDAPVTRYDGVHDAVSLLQRGDVACVVVDATAADLPIATVVRRVRDGGEAAVVVAVGPDDGPPGVGATAAAVVDRTATAATARTLEEVRTDALLDRSARRSSGAETLLRNTIRSIGGHGDEGLEPVAEAVVASAAPTGPYSAAWVGRHDTDRRVLQPVAAAGVPVDHLRAVPVDPATDEAGASTEGSATLRAVAADGDAAVFTERLETAGSQSATEGTHLLAVRIPTDPGAVLHLVADRPGGVPASERATLADLGAAIAATTTDSGASDAGEDRLRLLADVLAHELSNQLGAASLQLDLAEEHGDAEHFDHVARALDRLEGLTDETRALARAEPDREWTDLREVAESSWDAISTPNATLVVEDATLEVDSALLRLAVINLFRNAVEHGSSNPAPGEQDAAEHGSGTGEAGAEGRPAGADGSDRDSASELTVEIGPVGDDEGFYVADDGPGIPPEERERVLQWGHSGGDGTGVGLGLVRLVAERHGWTVDIGESESGGARVVLAP
ncbi:sensor histidine kinase [Haloglomus litoreum]|uniref:sensor histidine kinase n=1 Tax=Haloglomus litoreum TaxID=3034026 RepID=UPI0023E7E23A|nr:HAMP domain-containing sensor histidine kinase [Haloglomus sp. DT116]